MVSERYSDAFRFAQILHEKSNESPAVFLAEKAYSTGLYNKAIQFLDWMTNNKKAKQGVETFEVFHLKGKLLAERGQTHRAQTALIQALNVPLKVFGTSNLRQSLHYQLASLYACNGHLKDAQALFDENIPVNCGNGWITSTKVVSFTRSSEALDKLEASRELTFLHVEAAPPPPNRLTYLVAANFDYISKFGRTLVKALASLSIEGLHLHIHCVSIKGVKPLSYESLASIIEDMKMHNISFAVTYERVTLNFSPTVIQAKSVYSISRFIILPYILEKYKCPTLVADIDQIPLRSFRPLVENEYDVALLRMPKSVLNILSVVSATISIFRPNQDGLAAAKRLRQYFESGLKDSTAINWHIDQAGLAVLDYTNKTARIHYFDEGLVVTDPSQYKLNQAEEDGAYFWSVTNSIDGNFKFLDQALRSRPI